MKKITIIMALLLCAALTGCGPSRPADTPPAAPEETPAASEETPSGTETGAPSGETPETELPGETPEKGGTATLYIGTKSRGFTEYPLAYEGELTAETLIQGIADLTGWDLTLAEPVTSGKGGMSVCLAGTSALFQGPPEPQKEEFFMFGLDDLAETLLDSIQKTLQEGFTLPQGDPDNLDIWYCMEGGGALSLPGLGLSRPIDQPYQWADAVAGDAG